MVSTAVKSSSRWPLWWVDVCFAVLLLTLTWFAEVGQRATGASPWWPPAALIVLYLVREVPLRRTLPVVVAAGIAVSVLLDGGFANLELIVGSALAVAVAYGTGAGLLKRSQRVSVDDGPLEIAAFLLSFAVVAPLMAGFGRAGALALDNVVLAEVASGALRIA
ncbi:MAG: hypothetical protein ACI867_000390, partial [Glaciecola sp.]